MVYRKPFNPYHPRTMLWALIEEDWSDLTAAQIAEVFDVSLTEIYLALHEIWKDTGYEVPYTRVKRRNN